MYRRDSTGSIICWIQYSFCAFGCMCFHVFWHYFVGPDSPYDINDLWNEACARRHNVTQSSTILLFWSPFLSRKAERKKKCVWERQTDTSTRYYATQQKTQQEKHCCASRSKTNTEILMLGNDIEMEREDTNNTKLWHHTWKPYDM